MPKKPDLPRGIRNNNPGNIEYNFKKPVAWQNLADPPHDGRFCRFRTPPDGIRAICRTLITYQDKRRANDGSKIDTVREVIDRWAPPVENDTSAYVQAVRKAMQLDEPEVDEELDVHEYSCMKPLVKAIIKHENGMQPYTDLQIDKGLMLAGIHPTTETEPLQKSKVVQGGQISVIGTLGSGAAGVGTIATLAEQAKNAADNLSPLVYYGKWIMIAFVVLSLLGIGLTFYAKHLERGQGVG